MSPLKNVVLFTGENGYELREALRSWLAAFRQRHGDENLTRLDAGDVVLRTLLDEAGTAPFLAEKRLIVVSGIPTLQREEMERLLSQVHPDVILLFVAPKTDKRLGAVKFLLQEADVRAFPRHSGPALQQWLDRRLVALAAVLTAPARTLLLERLGDDQALFENELQKLALYAAGRPITPEDVELLTVTSIEREAWGLLNLLGQADSRTLLREVERLCRQGETPASIWPKFLWMISQLTPIYAALQAGTRVPADIARKTGLQERVVRSLLPFAQRLSPADLRRIITLVAGDDSALKTGGHRSTQEEPQEMAALLDRALIACSA